MRLAETGAPMPSVTAPTTVAAKPWRVTGLGEEGRVAEPVVAELEIAADDDGRDRQPLDQDAGDKILGAHLREGGIEPRDDDAVKPEGGGEPLP